MVHVNILRSGSVDMCVGVFIIDENLIWRFLRFAKIKILAKFSRYTVLEKATQP